MPTRAPRNRASESSFRPPSLTPSISTSPRSGRSSPAMIMSSVDLPEPEAPMMPTASPFAIVRLTLRNICTRAAPRPRLRSTPRMATAGRIIVSGFLNAGPNSYGHWRALVQALALGAALALAFAGQASARKLRLVVLGDSLAAGYGVAPGKAFPDQLQAALSAKGWDVKVVNAGVSGDTAEDGLARYDWAVPPDADALIVELGANDMLRGLPPERAQRGAGGHSRQGQGGASADADRRNARRAQSWPGIRSRVRRDLSGARRRSLTPSFTRSSSTASPPIRSLTSRTDCIRPRGGRGHRESDPALGRGPPASRQSLIDRGIPGFPAVGPPLRSRGGLP